MWMLERRERKYQLGTSNPATSLFFGGLTFAGTYAFLWYTTARSPELAFSATATVMACLAIFLIVKEFSYRRERNGNNAIVNDEIRRCEKMLVAEQGNISYCERLSELYERTGDIKTAAAYLERANKLCPSAVNSWRLKELNEKLSGK